jgi:transcriptional regulator with XRE-family HTH domain
MEKLEIYYKALEMNREGVSYQSIADQLGFSKNTIYRWCSGKTDLSKLKGIKGLNHSSISDEIFTSAVKSSFSIASSLKAIGLRASGGNYKNFYSRIKRLNLDISHFTGKGHLKDRTHNNARGKTIEETFVKNGTAQSSQLRKKIIRNNLKPYFCEICGISEWKNKALSLHVDHINGVNNDNRLENLRFLCPNCHSQTDTYCGRGIRKNRLA